MAEELIFNEVSSGARDDLQRATDIARVMVKEYGMSEKLGLVTFEEHHQAPFLLNPGYATDRAYSDATAYQIDLEVKNIIDTTYHHVRAILAKRIATLKELALLLLEKEVLGSDEFESIVRKEETEVRSQIN